jgi:hypothetical protein
MGALPWLVAAVVSSGSGPPAVTSFGKASDVVAYFGRAYPVPDPAGTGAFALCYQSPEGQPPATIFFEFKGRGLSDGVLIESRYDPLRALLHDRTFKDYRLQCSASVKVVPGLVKPK